ncbi:antitoxin VbhA family protein [Corynebacterium hesseae]
MTFAKGVSLLAGHEIDAEQEALVHAVVSGEMTVEEAIAIAKAQVK